MISISAELQAALQSSHTIAVQADLWFDGLLRMADLYVTDGAVTWDGSDDVAGSLTLTVADPDGELFAAGAEGLTALGSEIHLRRGVNIPGVGTQTVPLGIFRVNEVTFAEAYHMGPDGNWYSTGLTATLSAEDRMSYVVDSRFLAPSSAPAAATCKAELRRLCRALLPTGTWANITDAATPAGLVYEESRLDAVAALADAMAAVPYVGRDGALQLRPAEADPTAVAWTFDGNAGGLVSFTWNQTRDEVYNAVVARGEATSDTDPVQAVAYDTDPRSITRWDGPMKRVPFFYSSPLITTTAKARAAASTRLASLLGTERQYTFTGLPLPHLEPGDVVTVRTPRVTITGPLVTIALPIGTGAATYTMRATVTGGLMLTDPTPAALAAARAAYPPSRPAAIGRGPRG